MTATHTGDAAGSCTHPLISRVHFGARPMRARGQFDVRHGRSALARLLVRLLRLPREGRGVPLTLTIERRGSDDAWSRTFSSRTFTTLQRRGVWPPVERFGPLELVYAAEIDADSLSVTSVSARLRVGPLACTLPKWLAPRDRALVSARGSAAMHVRVRIDLPLAGELLVYEGVIEEVM